MRKILITIGLVSLSSLSMVGMFGYHKSIQVKNNKDLNIACNMIENSGTQQELLDGMFTGQVEIPINNSQWQNRVFDNY